jgi:predicted RNase H-like HicB family nuclease
MQTVERTRERGRMPRATLTATLWREGDTYVSLCPELDVSSCGDTPDEAIRALKEAVELYLENAKSLGTLDDLRGALDSPVRFSTTIEVATP